MSTPRLILINGFDRSGTSAISRTLAKHPSAELFMQPFNSGPLRKLIYQPLSDELLTQDDFHFFDQLNRGQIDREYIKSEWFFKYSSTEVFIPGQLHILKSTINHFSLPWIQNRYPEIDVWGIWREPLELLKSIFRNGFETWYANSFAAITKTIQGCPHLSDKLSRFTELELNQIEEVALNFSARTLHFFRYVPEGRVIRFDQFCHDPNRAFERFVQTNALDPFDFSQHAADDHNIIGKRDTEDSIDPLAGMDLTLTHKILAPAVEMLDRRFTAESTQA